MSLQASKSESANKFLHWGQKLRLETRLIVFVFNQEKVHSFFVSVTISFKPGMA